MKNLKMWVMVAIFSAPFLVSGCDSGAGLIQPKDTKLILIERKQPGSNPYMRVFSVNASVDQKNRVVALECPCYLANKHFWSEKGPRQTTLLAMVTEKLEIKLMEDAAYQIEILNYDGRVQAIFYLPFEKKN